MSERISTGEDYRYRLLGELWTLLDAQDRQLPRLRSHNPSLLVTAEALRNRTVNLIQRLLAEE
jgi:hypothetical protein